MCNDWCLDFVKESFGFWPEHPVALEVGSRDVNGSPRSLCAPRCAGYTGVDIRDGEGVDRIVDANHLKSFFPPRHFDVVLSLEMIERVPDWPNVLFQMMSVLRMGGLLIVTTRSIGFELPGYPDDYWRYSREDVPRLFEGVGDVLVVDDDMTLDYPCGVGMLIRKKADDAGLRSWKARLIRTHALYSVELSKRITFESFQGLKTEELPFDQYNRYRIIREALENLFDDPLSLSVLDVGGWPGTLQRFLPCNTVTITDIQKWRGEYVRANGCLLPFRDGAFDVAVSSDTIEHIAPDSRPRFLAELMRVNKRLLFLNAPFEDPEVVRAEKIVQSLIESKYGERYEFMEEHRCHGLPDLAGTLTALNENGFETAVLPNGYLPHWIIALSTFFMLQWRFPDEKLSARANAYYNACFYRSDNREPSYRKLIVASRTVELSSLGDGMLSGTKPYAAETALHLHTLNFFTNVLKEGWAAYAHDLQKELAHVVENNSILSKSLESREPGGKKSGKQRKRQAPGSWARVRKNLGRMRSGFLGVADRVFSRRSSSALSGSSIRKKGEELCRMTSIPRYDKIRPGLYDIFVFPVIDWLFRFQRPQQLARLLARAGHRVFYVQTVFNQKLRKLVVQDLEENVYSIRLPGSPRLNLYENELGKRDVGIMMDALDMLRCRTGVVNAVSIVDLPFWTPLAMAMRDRWGWRVVYDCMDDHSGFANNKEIMLKWEESLIAKSDLVITTARILKEKIEPKARRLCLVPNAADFDFFSRRPDRLPLSDLKGPVIGYYGAISEWFDVEMVLEAAKVCPEWQFVLIGSTAGADVTSLENLPNLHLLGEKDYVDLPGYLHRFDVACIPFKINTLTRATNPVKFFEYLSAGKPVVSVPLPELEPFRGSFFSVAGKHEFVPRIREALADKSAERRRERAALARQNDWSSRCTRLKQEFSAFFGRAAIIIVSYNNLDYLGQCLDSLWACTDYPDYRVVVVDNGSTPDVVDYLKAQAGSHERLQVLFNRENLGFARANNQGVIAAGVCDYIVLLNNDTIVTRGWLTRMIRYLSNPQIGLVGPVTNWAGNEARIDVKCNDSNEIHRVAERRSQGNEGRHFDISMLAMFCLGVRKPLMDRIGGLDERFEVGMFEDDDFSLRVKKAGYRIVCAEDIYIHHWGRASFGVLDKKTYDRIFEENRKKYEEKWGMKWELHTDKKSSKSVNKSELFDPRGMWWECNVCGLSCRSALDDPRPADHPCPGCGSTVMTRAMVHLLGKELFGESMCIRRFPERRELRGAGAIGGKPCVSCLEKKFGFSGVSSAASDAAQLDFLIVEKEHPPEDACHRLKPGGLFLSIMPDDKDEKRFLSGLEKAGFEDARVFREPFYTHGICWEKSRLLPAAARKK